MFNQLTRLKKIEEPEKAGQDENRSLDKSNEGISSSSQLREALPLDIVTREKEKHEKKKKTKKYEDVEGSFLGSLAIETRGGAVSSSTNIPGGASGSHKSQTAGLSVNDFISKTKKQQREGLKPSGPELIAYARYLGIDPVADHDLLWVAIEALEAPLPSDWTEHKDSNDRVFYYNATMRVSSWTHPLEHIYRETYKSIVTFRNANMSQSERAQKLDALRDEVEQMEREVRKEIDQWTQHEDEHKNKFYFNKEERKSTWTDPRPAKCQVLHLRMKMLNLLASSIVGTAGISELRSNIGGSRFAHPLSGVTTGAEDLAFKRPEVGNDEPRETNAAHENSPPASLGGSDSESDEVKKKKKEKREKKTRKESNLSPDEGSSVAAPPPRLGSKMRNSQSEPTVGGKPLLSNVDDVRGGLGGIQGSQSLSVYAVDHASDALSTAGRARPKAGIRLTPIGTNDVNGSMDIPNGQGVRSSASVPALQSTSLPVALPP
eukprot:CAMPEP_0169150052 /NCGR_PEP_ID=MMETSP1015-20121227/49923_1 /TAXON_ID=342587 /ORGANISM="Karlodinium micrum, Strain CCMP2283" /LENGTH=489 /DNA_ID=CAMNT_0009219051 /DNA_START=116 /DNA_END=1586 /DNA_ORIENTATION=+